jgi:3-oxoacyl-[acyl-carrier-protein] synthase-3
LNNVFARITGTGSYLPARRLTNDDLAAELAQRGVETSSEWIIERTGIQARHFAASGEGSSDLGFEAARRALEAAGRQPQDIDLIIVATSTPDMVFPSTACMIQHKLSQLEAGGAGIIGAAAFDVQAVCSGFVYALTVADAMIRGGNARRALVIGA